MGKGHAEIVQHQAPLIVGLDEVVPVYEQKSYIAIADMLRDAGRCCQSAMYYATEGSHAVATSRASFACEAREVAVLTSWLRYGWYEHLEAFPLSLPPQGAAAMAKPKDSPQRETR